MRLALALLMGLLLTGATRAQDRVAWDWSKNKSLEVEVATRLDQSLILSPQDPSSRREIVQKLLVTAVFGLDVVEQKPGSVKLTQSLKSLKIKAGKTETPLSLGDVKLTITLDDKGTVTALEGYDRLIERLGDDETRKQNLRSALSEKSLRESIEKTLLHFPAEFLKGKTHEVSTLRDLGVLGQIRLKQTFKYDDIEVKEPNRVAVLSVTIKGEDYKVGKPERALYQVESGRLTRCEGSGKVRFDLKAGRLENAETRVTLQGSFTLKDERATWNGELEQTQTITVKVLPRK